MEQVLRKIDLLLSEAGSNRKCLHWGVLVLKDMQYREQINAVWEAWIDPAAPPARPSIFASSLPTGILIEVSADLPPLKWSSVKYYFDQEDMTNGKEAAYS